jgi:hypothetical protein
MIIMNHLVELRDDEYRGEIGGTKRAGEGVDEKGGYISKTLRDVRRENQLDIWGISFSKRLNFKLLTSLLGPNPTLMSLFENPARLLLTISTSKLPSRSPTLTAFGSIRQYF